MRRLPIRFKVIPAAWHRPNAVSLFILQVPENALVNTIIYALNATVPFRMYNTRIVYRHEPTEPNPALAVHLSGAVVVRRALDAETMRRPFVLQVRSER